MDGSKTSLAGNQVGFFLSPESEGIAFIESLVLSFRKKLQNGDVSKNCVVRYTSDSFESYIF